MSLFDDAVGSLNDSVMSQFGELVAHHTTQGRIISRRALFHWRIDEAEDETFVERLDVSLLEKDGPAYIGDRLIYNDNQYTLVGLSARQGSSPGLLSFAARSKYAN